MINLELEIEGKKNQDALQLLDFARKMEKDLKLNVIHSGTSFDPLTRDLTIWGATKSQIHTVHSRISRYLKAKGYRFEMAIDI